MTRHDQFTGLLTDWLEDQPASAPDELLDSVLTDLRQTRQRARWWVALRRFPMFSPNAMRHYGVAGAIVLLAVIGFAVWGGQAPMGSGGQASPSPTSAPPSAPQPTPSTPSASQSAPSTPVPLRMIAGSSGPLAPGVYGVEVRGMRISFTVPDGWASIHEVGITTSREDAYISFTRPTNAFVNPCQPDQGVLQPALGRTVDDLAGYLTELPLGATATDVMISGFAGKHVTWTRLPGTYCLDALWTTDRAIPRRMADDFFVRPSFARTEVWILDVAGTRLAIYAQYPMDCYDTVVEPECPAQNIFARARAEVQAIVESMHIESTD